MPFNQDTRDPYLLSDINRRSLKDPAAFLQECDAQYAAKICKAADMILENRRRSPIVLLSGPSGSGKTTTAKKIEAELTKRGIHTHTISMDNYFRNRDEYVMPRTPDGEPDLESPLCMDMELLNRHFTLLAQGERIFVPRFEFARQMRVLDASQPLQLGPDDIAIFEGIHALNDDITAKHPNAFKLYISARSNIVDDTGEPVFKGTWMRLLRRTVRDNLFRGADAGATIKMWANVRRGEKAYISPFKDKADYQFNSALPYEVPVLKQMAAALFRTIPENAPRFEELKSILPALELFADIDSALVAPDSLLREFIGGGIFSY